MSERSLNWDADEEVETVGAAVVVGGKAQSIPPKATSMAARITRCSVGITICTFHGTQIKMATMWEGQVMLAIMGVAAALNLIRTQTSRQEA